LFCEPHHRRHAAAVARLSLSQLQSAANGSILDAMDDKLQKKLQVAFDHATAIANARGLSLEEALQLVADYLMNHPDADIRAFQEAHNRQVRKDLN
jgi:hypothetical protein